MRNASLGRYISGLYSFNHFKIHPDLKWTSTVCGEREICADFFLLRQTVFQTTRIFLPASLLRSGSAGKSSGSPYKTPFAESCQVYIVYDSRMCHSIFLASLLFASACWSCVFGVNYDKCFVRFCTVLFRGRNGRLGEVFVVIVYVRVLFSPVFRNWNWNVYTSYMRRINSIALQ